MTPSSGRERVWGQGRMRERKKVFSRAKVERSWERGLEGHWDESHCVFSWETKTAEWGWEESRKGIKSLSTGLCNHLLHYLKPCLIQACAVNRQRWDIARGGEGDEGRGAEERPKREDCPGQSVCRSSQPNKKLPTVHHQGLWSLNNILKNFLKSKFRSKNVLKVWNKTQKVTQRSTVSVSGPLPGL